MYTTFSTLIISFNLDEVYVNIFGADRDRPDSEVGGGANM